LACIRENIFQERSAKSPGSGAYGKVVTFKLVFEEFYYEHLQENHANLSNFMIFAIYGYPKNVWHRMFFFLIWVYGKELAIHTKELYPTSTRGSIPRGCHLCP